MTSHIVMYLEVSIGIIAIPKLLIVNKVRRRKSLTQRKGMLYVLLSLRCFKYKKNNSFIVSLVKIDPTLFKGCFFSVVSKLLKKKVFTPSLSSYINFLVALRLSED